MKTEPTDIDREAAQLFVAAPGMRVAYASHVNGREKFEWCRVRDGARGVYGTPYAIDTDDPATVGCIHVQVEQAEGLGMTVEVYSLPGGWFGTGCPGEGGRTRGAALVSAMRAIKGEK